MAGGADPQVALQLTEATSLSGGTDPVGPRR